MPTRSLKITTKSGPNGQGSKTFDRYEMRIYKRVIDINASADTVRKIVRHHSTSAHHTSRQNSMRHSHSLLPRF